MSLDLERWAKALEKWGIEWEQEDRWMGDILIESAIAVYIPIPYIEDDNHVFRLTRLSDHHSAAEFISRVTERCFGEWAYFRRSRSLPGNPFALYLDDASLRAFRLGSGPTKLDALLDALERNDPKEKEQ